MTQVCLDTYFLDNHGSGRGVTGAEQERKRKPEWGTRSTPRGEPPEAQMVRSCHPTFPAFVGFRDKRHLEAL